MTPRAVLIMAAILLLAAGETKEQAVKKEMAKLKGTWKLLAYEIVGDKKPGDFEITIDQAGKISLRFDGAPAPGFEGKVYIEPTNQPKSLRIEFRDSDPASFVYELTGDTLKMCPAEDKKLPRKVSLEDDSGADLLYNFERKKK
jgi:uncharacterized protein (TIGR03067 family)